MRNITLITTLNLVISACAFAQSQDFVEECVGQMETMSPAVSQTTLEVNSLLRNNEYLRRVDINSYRIDELGATIFSDVDGRKYRLPPDELPPAADPSDFHANPLLADPGLSVAAQMRVLQFIALPIGTRYAEELPTTSYALQVRPGVYYDTGAFESTPSRFLPGNIALDGTAAARQRGNIVFHNLEDSLQDIPFRGQLNNIFEGIGSMDVMQAYVDAFYSGSGNLRGRSYFARGYAGDTGFLIGKAETAFGDVGSAPMIASHGALPIGAPGNIDSSNFSQTGISQLRITRHWKNDLFETTFSLEEAETAGDVVSNNQNLHDWPALVSRVRYSPNDFDSYQFAAMYRPLGFISPTFVDRTSSGWGISFVGRKSFADRTRAVYFGAVGGEGIGGYIFGDIDAAVVTSPESISLLENIGGYIAFQQVLSRTDELRHVTTNFAYGFVDSEAVNADQNAQLQQAWCNLLWNASDSVALGIEYQYGHRLIEDRTSGDNHRITFIAEFTTPSGRAAGTQLRERVSRRQNRKHIQNRRL